MGRMRQFGKSLRIALGVCSLAGLALMPLESHAQLQQQPQQQQQLVIRFVRDPDPAPELMAKDVNGKELSLEAYKGKVVLLNFWATWCAPCQAEIPWFVEFERTYASRGLAVIGVSMDEDGWKSVLPWIDARKVNYRISVGDDALAKEYGGVDALPETLLIDRAGRIAARHVGVISKSEYENEVRQILEEN